MYFTKNACCIVAYYLNMGTIPISVPKKMKCLHYILVYFISI